MKLNVVIGFLLYGLSEGSVHYWCANPGECGKGIGVGPTYVCGKALRWDYYYSQKKRWIEDGRKAGDDYWRVGGFMDCCHASKKASCWASVGL